jgi:hypothetical protein
VAGSVTFCELGHMTARFAISLLVLMAATAAAHADGLASYSVNYDVKAAKEDKDLYLEGQASVTMARTCKGWTVGEIFQLAVERSQGAAQQKRISDKSHRLEERVSEEESTDGAALTYQSRVRQDTRTEKATGTATLGPEGGKLHTVLSRYKQDSDLPPGTLAPAAARAALLKALTSGKTGAIEIRTVEMLRFHKPIKQIFTTLSPEDQSISRAKPKDLKVADKDFTKGKVWALRRQVPEFNEFGDEFWLFHDSGVIVRQLVQRLGVQLLLEAGEVTIFPPPTCQ